MQLLNILDTGTTGFVLSFNSLAHGLMGLVVLLLIAYLFSTNRKAINWKQIGIALALQIILAVCVLYVTPVRMVFEFVGKIFVVILEFTKAGTSFLLGDLMDGQKYGYIFAFQVLPTVVFFSALTSLLFYLGIIQKVVAALAWVMIKTMRLSGAESLSVAGNIFLGQTESPLLIKEYLDRMNRSEILLVMVGGMATLAGGVLAAYIGFLGGDDPVQRLAFAKHLLAASVMAAPGAVIFSKILIPQTESINMEAEVSREKVGKNVLDAIANGTTDGMKLAVNVAAMLLVFIAFIAMFNFIIGDYLGAKPLARTLAILTGVTAATFMFLNFFGKKKARYISINAYIWSGLFAVLLMNDLFAVSGQDSLNNWVCTATGGLHDKCTFQFILGYTFAPLMWVLGVAPEDITLVGRVVGEKIIMTEFIGYTSLAELKFAGAFTSPKSIIMATYMLCGFANFASIGIQIGGIGSLAPSKRVWLSEFGMRALLAGMLAGLLSGTIVGALS